MVGVPQLSLAVGAINDAAGLGGLHPGMVMNAVPVTVGGIASAVQVIVCTKGMLSLLHASTNIHVLVCVLVQLAPGVMAPSTG